MLVIAIGMLLPGCLAIWVPNNYWKAMNCYDGEYTGIDTLISIDGYYFFDTIIDVPEYLASEKGKLVRKTQQTIANSIFFSSDGFVIKDFYFKDSIGGLTAMPPSTDGYQIRGGSQGVYEVRGDTIIVQTLYWTDQNISPIESKYLIRSRTSLEIVAERDFARRMTKYEIEDFESVVDLQGLYNLKKFVGKVDVDGYFYIKQRKKFYCNEELYENYKGSVDK